MPTLAEERVLAQSEDQITIKAEGLTIVVKRQAEGISVYTQDQAGNTIKEDWTLFSEAEADPITVSATAYSDDHRIHVSFDATTWFEASSDDEIKALADIEWGGNLEADRVAQFMEDRDPEVKRLFDYLALNPTMPFSKDPVGFECHVSEDDALAWIRQKRPTLYELLTGEHGSPPNAAGEPKASPGKILDGIVSEVLKSVKFDPAANALGEILRAWAFAKEYGCYSCFDLIEGFQQRPMSPEIAGRLMGRPFDPESTDEDDQDVLNRGFYAVHANGVEVAWYWDGDGTLWFRVPGEVEVINTDCKKDYEWQVVAEDGSRS